MVKKIPLACFCVAWASALALVPSVSASEVQDVIHLDLAPLGEGGDPVPPQSAEGLSSRNDSKIHCTDSQFPSDVFCEVSASGRVSSYDHQPVTTKFFFRYRHPARSDAECFVFFENQDEATPSRLLYKSASCFESPEPWLYRVVRKIRGGEISAVPHDGPPPETLRVADMTALEFEDRSTENLSHVCRRKFKRSEAGATGPSVTFDHDALICISSAPAQFPPREV